MVCLCKLAHLSRLEFLTVINWTSLFPLSGLLGGIIHFYPNLNIPFCKQKVAMSNKKDARLIWVKSR